MAYTQDRKLITIDSPLGKDELLLLRFSGTEGMSRLFEFQLDMVSENHTIQFKNIIGQGVTVTIKLYDGDERFFHGIVSRFSQKSGDRETGPETPDFSFYTATIVPNFWLLTRTADSRIFQKKSVPDIIEQIFGEQGIADYELKLSGTYEEKEYCVQYHETDFNFVSRLMEQEGIHYFFKHEKEKHILIIADAASENKECPHQEEAIYQPDDSGLDGEDKITDLVLSQEIRAAKYTVNDYNFETPNVDLTVDVSTKETLGPGERELYDYPARFAKREQGDRLANLRLQEEEAQITTIRGTSRCRDFTSGYKFKLNGYYRSEMNDKKYILTSLRHEASEPLGRTGEETIPTYSNAFTCMADDVPFRPVRSARKPVVEGTQPAVVVGPSGEEIYTDEYGRVKVQFVWDREGKKDENSSCWVRVSQQWAGAGWGGMFIPHIGHEVIVDFEEGDPDRPIITGRVYNANNQPHDKLPDEKTKSVIRSWNDNDIVIEDKDGDKHIQIKQANGNEVILHEGTPSIDINQACGNFIHMRDGEGIHLKDQYGNEVKLDAAAGFIRIASPTADSYIEVGKSINSHTTSNEVRVTFANSNEEVHGNSKKVTFGNSEEEVYGNTFKTQGGITNEKFFGVKGAQMLALSSETYGGVKHSSLAGAEIKINAAAEVNKNAAAKTRDANGPLKYESKAFIKMEGGGASGMMLNSGNALLKSGSSMLRIAKGGDITIKTGAKVNIEGSGGVVIDGPTCTIKSKTEVMKQFKSKNIKDPG